MLRRGLTALVDFFFCDLFIFPFEKCPPQVERGRSKGKAWLGLARVGLPALVDFFFPVAVFYFSFTTPADGHEEGLSCHEAKGEALLFALGFILVPIGAPFFFADTPVHRVPLPFELHSAYR